MAALPPCVVQQIKAYQREGYIVEFQDVEESTYADEDTGETGDRVVFHVALKRVRAIGAAETKLKEITL